MKRDRGRQKTKNKIKTSPFDRIICSLASSDKQRESRATIEHVSCYTKLKKEPVFCNGEMLQDTGSFLFGYVEEGVFCRCSTLPKAEAENGIKQKGKYAGDVFCRCSTLDSLASRRRYSRKYDQAARF